ncbi:MAG TPA: vitamin B12 dependent-methionine synthase activation domain-containing protein [Vicinamibacteria bacterium]|nr:vitamin B12 dependent-methionine synthase activation domain-containing protein [Vicinamibacteria bacterium]
MPPVALGPLTLHGRYSFAEARPREEDVLRVMGYVPLAAPAAVVAAVRGRLGGEDEALWAIEGGAVLFPAAAVDAAEPALAVEEVRFEVGRTLAGQLAGAEAVVVFLCTAGPGMERRARQLVAEGDPFTGFIADALASLVVERAADLIEDRVRDHAERCGLHLTNRYSPGYCGWRVEEQQKLFSLLPPGFCGVRLSDSSLMQPIKSVSGIIGLGRTVHRRAYACHLCDLESCLYRRLQPVARADG